MNMYIVLCIQVKKAGIKRFSQLNFSFSLTDLRHILGEKATSRTTLSCQRQS